MAWFVRAAREDDVDALLALAEQTGGGFTNLPANRDSLAKRLRWSAESYARTGGLPLNELYFLLLEEAGSGRIGGSALLYSKLGVDWPFYSYKIATINQTSKELGRNITMEVLHLVNDFNGAAEVGGLFLLPELRADGLGRLLARSRYLFLARHRERFPARIIAELRGWLDDEGGSPFWDGLGRAFFGMPFQEADRFNAVHGNQFIADLMPKYPIYTALLPESARAVIGKPHSSGIPALKMLEKEGFAHEGYVDIFDGGPTVSAQIDHVRTVHDCRKLVVAGLDARVGTGRASLLATGQLTTFRAWQSDAVALDATVSVPAAEAELHAIQIGDLISHVAA
jgi:arginine N-succinyltransferase